MIKSLFKRHFLLFCLVFSHFFCTQPSENNKPIAAKPTEKADTTLSSDFATAQIALNIETLSGTVLANVNLALHAPLSKKNIYTIKNLIVDDGEKGPFNALTILDKAVISKNKNIKIVITYELQTQTIHWETEQGALTGNFGDKEFKQSVQSAGGSIRGVATLVFDAITMQLLSQNSANNENRPVSMYKNGSRDETLDKFVAKNLKIKLATTVNWMNADCRAPNPPCSSGLIKEVK
jgi:hypothetical protein